MLRETLAVEFIEGYAGVRIGIAWKRFPYLRWREIARDRVRSRESVGDCGRPWEIRGASLEAVAVLRGVPRLEAEPRVVLGGDLDGRGPVPHAENLEELLQEHGGRGVRVHLADEGREDVAVDAAEVAHLVRVEAAALGPEADAAQQLAEGVKVGHELLDEVGDARAVERLLGPEVDARQDRVVVDVQIVGHGVEWQLREQ